MRCHIEAKIIFADSFSMSIVDSLFNEGSSIVRCRESRSLCDLRFSKCEWWSQDIVDLRALVLWWLSIFRCHRTVVDSSESGEMFDVRCQVWMRMWQVSVAGLLSVVLWLLSISRCDEWSSIVLGRERRSMFDLGFSKCEWWSQCDLICGL